MARSSQKACKWARREGSDLFLKTKGIKTKKSERRPGQHGAKASRLSNYGVQLRAKQKIKRIYGVSERQFYNYYAKAAKKKGATGVVLLQMLESRLDNTVYRAGFGSTRPESRQMVSHGAVLVNGHKVNVASYLLKPGDIVSIAEKAKQHKRIETSLLLHKEKTSIDWIDTDLSEKSAIFKRLPQRDELPAEYNEQLIVELYSK